MYEGLYAAALSRLEAQRAVLADGERSGLRCYILSLAGDRSEAARPCERALAEAESSARAQPEFPFNHVNVAVLCALLGRSPQAHAAIDTATTLLPFEQDHWQGFFLQFDRAVVLAWLGETDAALDQVEWLLSLPAGLSAPWLRIEYQLSPLRGHPRFEALVAGAAVPVAKAGKEVSMRRWAENGPLTDDLHGRRRRFI